MPVGTKHAVRGTGSLSTGSWNEKTRSNKEKNRQFTQSVKSLLHERDGQLAGAAGWVNFLLIHGGQTASIISG